MSARKALFPALAANVFRTGPTGLGLLYAAPGAGAFLGALLTGWVGRVRFQGRAVIVASGFSHRTDPAALVLGPSGLAYDALHRGEAARAARDFALADRLRDELRERGRVVALRA